MVIFKLIFLFPLSIIYHLITSIRNWLYDIGFFKSYQSRIFTINVGNLAVGGTGKTPHIEHLIRLLSIDYEVVVLSRGYGRKSKGFILADEISDAELIGDEPLQYFNKYRNKIKVAVCENRVDGAKRLAELFPKAQILLLDDAFQHRAIKSHLNILLTDSNQLFTNDFLLPFGRLREGREGAKRADHIIITKSKSRVEIPQNIGNFNKFTTFSGVKYGNIKNYIDESFLLNENKIIAISGIANPHLYNEFVNTTFRNSTIKNYPDHYNFKKIDIARLIENNSFKILTTEKDYVKIKPLLNEDELKRFFYLPIEVDFFGDMTFDNWILKKINAGKNL